MQNRFFFAKVRHLFLKNKYFMLKIHKSLEETNIRKYKMTDLQKNTIPVRIGYLRIQI